MTALSFLPLVVQRLQLRRACVEVQMVRGGARQPHAQNRACKEFKAVQTGHANVRGACGACL